MDDEADALLHVEPDLAEGGGVFGLVAAGFGRSFLRLQKDHRGDDAGGADEADRVEDVATGGAEIGDHERCDGRADDAHSEHDLLDKRIGGAQAVKWDGGADGNSLSRAEEAGDDADGGEDRVEVPDLCGERGAGDRGRRGCCRSRPWSASGASGRRRLRPECQGWRWAACRRSGRR